MLDIHDRVTDIERTAEWLGTDDPDFEYWTSKACAISSLNNISKSLDDIYARISVFTGLDPATDPRL